MTGFYYAIGGIKNVQVFGHLIKKLVSRVNSEQPKVLYLDPEGNSSYTNHFAKGLKDLLPQAKFSSAVLQSKPEGNMNEQVLSADFVYIGGAEKPLSLKSVIIEQGLKGTFDSAVQSGTIVGGLCAGGSIHADYFISHSDGNKLAFYEQGLGLIPDIAISAKIDYGWAEERFKALQQLLKDSTVSQAYAVGSNFALVFQNGEVELVNGTKNGQCRAFRVEHDDVYDMC